MSSQFDAHSYIRFRPLYPPETFEGLTSTLKARGVSAPYRVADIGCGTGYSTLSLIRSGFEARLTCIDPDPAMLAEARRLLDQQSNVILQSGSAEDTGLPSRSFDVVIIGSAFHWMNPALAEVEFTRILTNQGIIRIFEYQFPKSPDLPELNEWIRREFNLRWKAPQQKPRGSLKELIGTLLKSGDYRLLGEGRPPMRLRLTVDELVGLIVSQSRVIHHLSSLSDDQKRLFTPELRDVLAQWMGETSYEFDFKLAWIELGRVPPTRS